MNGVSLFDITGAAGFSAGGVVAGSAAAAAQSAIGNVVAGSAFAALQSAGNFSLHEYKDSV